MPLFQVWERVNNKSNIQPWCVWFWLQRFVLNTLFLGAICIGDVTLRSMEGILMSGLQEAKYQISEADWELMFFALLLLLCVFLFEHNGL